MRSFFRDNTDRNGFDFSGRVPVVDAGAEASGYFIHWIY